MRRCDCPSRAPLPEPVGSAGPIKTRSTSLLSTGLIPAMPWLPALGQQARRNVEGMSGTMWWLVVVQPRRSVLLQYQDARPLLFIVSGPSGAGKGTALRVLRECGVVRVPTYTTRHRRPDEQDGLDYRFIPDDAFFNRVKSGEIFEYTRTYSDSFYGSPHDLLSAAISQPIASEMDPLGFSRVRARTVRRTVGIFVATASEETLRSRISIRGQAAELQQRLAVRAEQMAWSLTYDYVVFNDGDVKDFQRRIANIVEVELLRTRGAIQVLDLRAEVDPTL